MAKDFDIGQVQPMQGGTYQGLDANITNPGRSSSMDQLVHAVGTFEEGVRKYAVTEQMDISHEQTQQVLANLNEAEAKSRQSAAELVRNGQLALGANPYAAKAARRMFMQGIAKRTGDEIAQEYESSPVRNLSPEEVANWTREQYAKKSKAMGFTDPHDIEYLDGFMPVQEQMVDKLVGYHTQVAAKRTERDLKEGIAQSAADVASANLATPEVAAKDVAQNTLRTALMTGMAPRDAYENVLDGLISKAYAEGDTGFLDVAELVPTINDRSEEVPMGSRVWAQEKINDARARIESEEAQANKAASNNQKLVLEQNKDAILAEAGDILFGGKAPLPATIQQYEAVIQKAQQLVSKGILDPEVVPKLRKMREDEVEANLKASERGERIGDYGAQASLEATQLIQSGQIKSLAQVAELYSNPAMAPFRKDGFKAFNDYTKAQETEYRYNLQGIKMGIFNDANISALGVEQKTSIASQWNGQIAAFEQERSKAGQAVTVGEMNEFASNLADQLIARYTQKPDKNGDTLSKPKDYVESYRDTLIAAMENEKDKVVAATQYNKHIDERVPQHVKDLEDLPKTLAELGMTSFSDAAIDSYSRVLGAITGTAEASGSADAKYAAKALNEFVANRIAFERQRAGTDKARATMSESERGLYQRVAPLMPMPSLPIYILQPLLKSGDAVIVGKDGAVPGYSQGIYLKNPDKGMKVIVDYVMKEIQATKKPIPQPERK